MKVRRREIWSDMPGCGDLNSQHSSNYSKFPSMSKQGIKKTGSSLTPVSSVLLLNDMHNQI